MNRWVWPVALVAAALLVLSCEEITTRSETSTFVVTIAVGNSGFIAQGDTLLNDEVRFTATVTENSQPVSFSGATFISNDPNVVQILNASTGDARFVGTGTANVSVEIATPDLEGSEPLQASMNVRVTQFTVTLGLVSIVTGSTVVASDALLDDTLRITATVRKDGREVQSTISGVTSGRPSVIETGVGGPDRAALIDTGTAVLTVTLSEPEVPGPSLTATLTVTVKDFIVVLDVESLVDNSFLTNGDTLLTDSVRFSATLIKAGNDTVPTSGPTWASSNTAAVRIVDDTDGTAVFEGLDTASVSVTFADPPLPGAPASRRLRVTTFNTQVDVESVITGPGPLADTLLTDSVRFIVSATREKDGQSRPVTIGTTTSSDPSRLSIIDSPGGLGVLADTGQVTATLMLTQPQLPRAMLQDDLPFRITTYLARIDSLRPAAPIMGDTVRYFASAWATRPDPDTALTAPAFNFATSNDSVIRIVNAATGTAFVKDTGTARVDVTLTSPALPAAVATDTAAPTSVTVERFYGQFSKTGGTFGTTQNGDTVKVAASEVHFFTDSTRVLFPNGTLGFVDRVTPAGDSLIFFVPAAADTGQLTLRNLRDDLGNFRDNVLTRIVFDGPGSAVVNDFFEPNETFPLDSTVLITFPFPALLSSDPNKSAPADTNFFWFEVPSAQTKTLDILADWQEDADIDFKICNAVGLPPTSYDPALCPRPDTNNTTDARTESENGLLLTTGRYVIGFYCVTCPAIPRPLTYRVTITEQ